MACDSYDDTRHDSSGIPPYVATFTPTLPIAPSPSLSVVLHNPTSQVKFDADHWQAIPVWIEQDGLNFQTGNVGDFPGGTEFTGIIVTRVSELGVVTQYDVAVEYGFSWNGGHALNTCHNLCTFIFQVFRVGWFVRCHDARLVTDGTNLWLIALSREERPYPWYHQHFDVGFLDPPELLEACASASQTCAGGPCFLNYQGAFLCGGVPDYGDPFDDLGEQCSQRWHPFGVVAYIFDGGGFTRIGNIDAWYVNDQPPDGQWDDCSFASRLSVAASPAEPGVCHVAWSEFGVWGQRDPGPGKWPNRGGRLNYSRWDPGGEIFEEDLLRYDQIFDRLPYPPPARPAGLTTVGRQNGEGDTDPLQGLTSETFGWTPLFALKNEHGSPIMFVSRPIIVPPANPTTGFTSLKGGSVNLEVWDLSAGPVVNAPTVIATLTNDLLPTASDTSFLPNGPPGFTPDHIPIPLGANAGEGISGSVNQLIPRVEGATGFALSNLYSDPTLGGTDVYEVIVSFQGPSFFSGGTAVGVYRVPAAGGSFSYIDGDRDIAILPNATHPQGFGYPIGTYVPVWDFVSEPRDVWVPNSTSSGDQSQANLMVYLDRVCTHDWQITHSGPFPPTIPTLTKYSYNGSEFYWDPVLDRLYYVAFDYTIPITDPAVFTNAIGMSRICRRCLSCDCVESIWFWRKGHAVRPR